MTELVKKAAVELTRCDNELSTRVEITQLLLEAQQASVAKDRVLSELLEELAFVREIAGCYTDPCELGPSYASCYSTQNERVVTQMSEQKAEHGVHNKSFTQVERRVICEGDLATAGHRCDDDESR